MTQKTPMDMDEVYRLYVVENWPYAKIGKKYKCTPSTVGNRLMTYAEERGLGWPLKPQTQVRKGNVDSVDSTLIVGEIRECIKTYRISQIRLAQVCGITSNHLYQITGGFKPRIHRKTAEKIERGIGRVERGTVKWEREGVRLPIAVRDECDNGHRYTGRRDVDGRRKCNICRAEKDRRGWDRKVSEREVA